MTQTATTSPSVTTNFDTLKAQLKATWMDGNYDYFSRFMESSAVEFLDRLDVPAGARFLDVACDQGNSPSSRHAAERGSPAWTSRRI